MTRLDLNANNLVADQAWLDFAGALTSGTALSQLHHLSISFNPHLGDQGVAALVDSLSAGAMPKLSRLQLEQSSISSDGYRALKAVARRGSTSLHVFGVDGTSSDEEDDTSL